MDDIDEAMDLKPGGDDMDLYPIDKTDLIDISSLKAEQNLDIVDSTIDNFSAESSSTDTVNTESVSLNNVKQENSTSEELHKKISTNVSSYLSDINLKLKSNAKKASNKKSISIVDITEENDNSDESLNPIEQIVKL
ncbi:uncharacterized protein LOC115882427 [Sitophilus oryzae]|uniref:Uncharacterized protein LOC115882427 n=1 Tax=Sitophilus oryzae TaxID=7048 RepID=A0A6J2XXV4_SITOR|nr:uncharacterized protein LOC115882427 [Sitophilus oryzae]